MTPASPQDREAALRRVRRAVSPAEGEALRGWAAREGATRTIEIGLGYGISPLFVCEGRRFDLAYLGRLLRPGAVVFLDQWAVLRTARTADERRFDFYVDF